VVHGEDTTNVSRIIPKEDASKGCEGAEEISVGSDGRLDAAEVAGPAVGRRSPAAHSVGYGGVVD
jgi:hypothetical protein